MVSGLPATPGLLALFHFLCDDCRLCGHQGDYSCVLATGRVIGWDATRLDHRRHTKNCSSDMGPRSSETWAMLFAFFDYPAEKVSARDLPVWCTVRD